MVVIINGGRRGGVIVALAIGARRESVVGNSWPDLPILAGLGYSTQ